MEELLIKKYYYKCNFLIRELKHLEKCGRLVQTKIG